MENQQPINENPQSNTPHQKSNQCEPAQPPLQRWLPTIIGVAVVVFAGAGVFVYQTWWSAPSEPAVTQEAPTGTTPTEFLYVGERVEIDEIANWRTYRNEEFGFEVKYPQDWQAQGEVPYTFSITNGRANITIDPNGNGRGLYFTPKQESNITISEKSAERTDFLTDDNKIFFSFVRLFGHNENGWDPDYNYILLDSSKGLEFEMLDDSTQVARGTVQDFSTLNQILSTFKVIGVDTTAKGTQPSISITSPTPQTIWKIGSTHTISWDSVGVEEIRISSASGGKNLGDSSSIDAKAGKYTNFKVPDLSGFGIDPPYELKVRVYNSKDSAMYDEITYTGK